MNMTWIALALGKQLLGIFTSETMKQRTCRYQSNQVGVELCSHVNTFVKFVLQIFCTEI